MKQYRALIKHKEFHKDTWMLAIPGEGVYPTKEEAETAIQQAIKNGKAHWIGVINADGTTGREWFDSLEIVDSKIETREVTEWITI